MRTPLLTSFAPLLVASGLAGCVSGPPGVLRAAPPVLDPYTLVGPVSSVTVVRRVPAPDAAVYAAAARDLVVLPGARPGEAVRIAPPTAELQPRLMELERPALDVFGSPEQVALLERFVRDREQHAGREAILSVSLERFDPGDLPTVLSRSRLRDRDVLVVEGPLDAEVRGDRIADAAGYVEDGELCELEGPVEVLGVQWFRVQRGPRTALGLNAQGRIAWTGEDPLEPGVVVVQATYQESWGDPQLRFAGRAVLRPGEEMWLIEQRPGDDSVWVLRASWMNKAAWEQLVELWQQERSKWR